jgi:hypothetical protein
MFDENKVSSFRSPVRERRRMPANRTDLLTLPLRERLTRRMALEVEAILDYRCSYREAGSRWVEVETTHTATLTWAPRPVGYSEGRLTSSTTTVWHKRHPWKGQSVEYHFSDRVQDVARRVFAGLLTVGDKRDRRWLVEWASTPVACIDGVRRAAVQYSRQGRGFEVVSAWAVVAHDSNTGWYVERSYSCSTDAEYALERHAARAAKRSHRRAMAA